MKLAKYHAYPQFVRGVRLRWEPVRQQYFLLFPEGALMLNATAADILHLCDGQHNVVSIIELLTNRYQTPAVVTDVNRLLAQLVERGLLIYNTPA